MGWRRCCWWRCVVGGRDPCCPSRLCRRLGIGGERFGLGHLVIFSLLRGCGHVRDDEGNIAWLEVATEHAGGVWSALLACALLGLPGVRSPYTSWFRKALICKFVVPPLFVSLVALPRKSDRATRITMLWFCRSAAVMRFFSRASALVLWTRRHLFSMSRGMGLSGHCL